MGFVATMSSKGQLTIPKDVRDELKLATGTQLYISVRGGELVARPKNRSIVDLAGVLGRPGVGAGASLRDLDEAVGQALAEEDRRIAREWTELSDTKA